jgi:hypothetical protein
MRDRIWSPLWAADFRNYSVILAVSARLNQESGVAGVAGVQEQGDWQSKELGVDDPRAN